MVHGSPCQDISIAGKQLGADKDSGTRSSLLYETLRIIRNFGIWKPRVVIWENVRNVISKYMIHNFNGYLKELEELGYVNSFEVVNALDYGLPQNRERVFVVSILGGKPFRFDEMEKKRLLNISEFLEQNVDERYIVTQESMLRMIEGRFKNPNFKRKIDIIGDYCNTITTRQVRCPNSGVIDIGNGRYRYLTEKECWRLQGFRDCDYDAALKANPSRKGCMNNTLYRQAGNSMPVTVLKEIFRVLLKDVI